MKFREMEKARQKKQMTPWFGQNIENEEMKSNARYDLLNMQEYVEQQIRNDPDDKGCMWKTIQACIPKKSANTITYRKVTKP